MDDSEKLTALKKAYAEIILNTAKEAAARIMVSEKKAMRFQQELSSTKEEALRMLLRIKHMLDSKVTEVEMTSLNQQKKIEELEAQLQEAEDIVRDLREELREVQAKLEKVTNGLLQPLDEQNLEGDTVIQEGMSQEEGVMNSGSIFSLPDSQLEPLANEMKNLTSNSNGTYAVNKCYSANGPNVDSCYLPNPYFASIVMRSKEPELYRNGCTQRIRAFEKYLLGGELSLSGQTDDATATNETFITGDEEYEGLYKASIHKPDNMLGVEEKNQDEHQPLLSAGNHLEGKAIKSVHRKRRKRATKYRKSKASSSRQDNNMCVIPTHEAENMLRVEENLDTEMQANRCDINVQILKSFCRKRKRAARYVKNKAPSCRSLADQVMEMHQASDLSNSKSSPDSISNNEESVDDPSKIIENEGQKDPVSAVAPMLLSDATDMHLVAVDMTKKDVEFVKACSVQNKMNNGTAVINKSDITRQESLSAENSELQGCRADVEAFDESLVNSDLKTTDLNDVVGQTVNNRFLKYTFRRKRKKESLSSPDGDSSLDNGTLKRKTGDKQNGSLEPQNSSLIIESSRDSRRLAQVARQLISLSEKKWWQ